MLVAGLIDYTIYTITPLLKRISVSLKYLGYSVIWVLDDWKLFINQHTVYQEKKSFLSLPL